MFPKMTFQWRTIIFTVVIFCLCKGVFLPTLATSTSKWFICFYDGSVVYEYVCMDGWMDRLILHVCLFSLLSSCSIVCFSRYRELTTAVWWAKCLLQHRATSRMSSYNTLCAKWPGELHSSTGQVSRDLGTKISWYRFWNDTTAEN